MDTITAVIPIEEAVFQELPGAQILRSIDCESGRVSERQTATLKASGLQVATQALFDGRARLLVSGSLPKAVDGHNLKALPVDQVGEVMRDLVVPELLEVAGGVNPEAVRFSRLDTVTDLACDEDDIGPVLKALEAVPIRKGVRKSLLRSTTERPETLFAQNKGGGMRLYNKGLEAAIRKVSLDLIREHQPALRAEAQARTDWLESMSCRELKDVERFPENVSALHMKRASWAGVDRSVMSLSTWVDEMARYCESKGLRPSVRNGAMSYALMVAHGRDPQVSKNTATKYRQIMREAGVQPADIQQAATKEVHYQLDFERGKVLRSVA